MKRLLYASIIACSLITSSLCGQGRSSQGSRHERRGEHTAGIRGEVVSDEGPLELATVYLEGTNIHTTTDAKGRYHLHAPKGRYTLKVQYMGYKPYSSVITLGEDTKMLRNIRLSADEATTLSTHTVTGKSRGRHLRERGFAVETVNTQLAAMQNVLTTELLNRSAGIKIRQSAGVGSDVSFNLNGLSGNSVRIFIDGIPMRNYGRSFSLSSIPPAMIERIEVYKGVLPADLAEDALGGGINIVLKRDMRNSLTTSYSYGSFNTHQWDMNGSYRHKPSGLSVQGSAFYNKSDNSYDVWGESVYIIDETSSKVPVRAKRFHDGYLAYGARASVGFTRKPWADELLLGGMISHTDKDIQTGATMQVVYGNRTTNYDSRLVSLTYKKQNLLLRGLDLNTYTTYSHTNRQVVDTIPDKYNWLGMVTGRWNSTGEAGNKTLSTNLERNLSNRSSLRYRLNRQHSLSLSYMYDAFTRDIDDPMLTNEQREVMDQRRYRKYILGATYQTELFDQRLKLSAFYKYYNVGAHLTELKYTHTPLVGSTLQPIKHDRSLGYDGYGFASSIKVNDWALLLLSAERAIRLPSTTELLGNTSENIEASLTLRPEQSYNFNLGVNLGSFKLGMHHDLSLDINLFHRNITDMIQRGVPRGADDFYGFENLGSITSSGLDAEIRYRGWERLFATANMSYFDARFNLEFDPYSGMRNAHYRSRLRNAPFLTSNFSLEYDLGSIALKGSKLSASYHFGYTHEFYRDWEAYGSANKIMIPTQALHDFGLSYRLPGHRLTLSFDAKNIFDTPVFDNYALQKPGRSFHIKATYRIL